VADALQTAEGGGGNISGKKGGGFASLPWTGTLCGKRPQGGANQDPSGEKRKTRFFAEDFFSSVGGKKGQTYYQGKKKEAETARKKKCFAKRVAKPMNRGKRPKNRFLSKKKKKTKRLNAKRGVVA